MLIDDLAGRRYLHERHHSLTGTLGVIIEAKRQGLLTQVAPPLDLISNQGFWIDDAVRRQVLKIAGKRLGKQRQRLAKESVYLKLFFRSHAEADSPKHGRHHAHSAQNRQRIEADACI